MTKNYFFIFLFMKKTVFGTFVCTSLILLSGCTLSRPTTNDMVKEDAMMQKDPVIMNQDSE